MEYLARTLSPLLERLLAQKQSVLLLGARQTGKTTLIQQVKVDLALNLIEPETRIRYEERPSLLLGETRALAERLNRRPLIFIDEIQKTPLLLDVIQSLIDQQVAQFILTGSSARKLRHGKSVNLLPGRLVHLQLDSLNSLELRELKQKTLEDYLLDGALPGMITISDPELLELKLRSYVTTYLEEEIRQEAAVRQLGTFSRFLQLAAQQAGYLLNLQKLSQELGVAHTTISRYIEILEDCLIAEQIPAFHATNPKRQLVKAPKLLFFDLGVRRIAAQEGRGLPQTVFGHLFEQWVGLEIQKLVHFFPLQHQLYTWRDRNGIEVDWVLALDNQLLPFEVKWTTKPTLGDAKHLQIFLNEHSGTAKNGYVICRVPRRIKFTDEIDAIPWQELPELLTQY